MKVLLLCVMILMLCGSGVYAADFTILSDESIAQFMELMPQYKALAEKYGTTVNEINALPQAAAFTQEVQQLFAKYGATFETFPAFMQKISMGLAQIEMQNAGMNAMSGMFGDMPALSNDEVRVLKANSEKLKAFFDEM